MANTLKNIKKRYKKKKLRAQKAKLLKEQQAASGNEYKARLSRHRYSKAKKTVLTAAAVAGIIFAVLFYMEKRSYHDYKTLQTSEQEDIVSTKYEEMSGKSYDTVLTAFLLCPAVWKRYGAKHVQCRIRWQM